MQAMSTPLSKTETKNSAVSLSLFCKFCWIIKNYENLVELICVSNNRDVAYRLYSTVCQKLCGWMLLKS